jgi:hypothetical protein
MATILDAANPMSETASLHTIKTEHDLQPVRTGGCNKPITAVVHALGRLRLAAIVQPSCGHTGYHPCTAPYSKAESTDHYPSLSCSPPGDGGCGATSL